MSQHVEQKTERRKKEANKILTEREREKAGGGGGSAKLNMC